MKEGDELSQLKDGVGREWETRSKCLGATLRSVLFKGLPEVVNEQLHHWHEKMVLNWIEEKEDLKILDAGCGYGRLSIPVLEKFPKVDITGIDISENYVRLYQERTGHFALVGTIENIPETLGFFDDIVCITVLMYLDDEKLKKAISQLFLHLKREGRLILIEPHRSGILFQTGFGMVMFLRNIVKRDRHRIRSRYFTSKELGSYFQSFGGTILSERRLPITSLFFLPIVLAGKLLPYRMTQKVCKMVSLLDGLLGESKLPSIYAAYLVMKN
jgi:2-polyprenyl-3-methyl-5-hydroxy-6-metoxy-1,4-benzoquinol methylase